MKAMPAHAVDECPLGKERRPSRIMDKSLRCGVSLRHIRWPILMERSIPCAAFRGEVPCASRQKVRAESALGNEVSWRHIMLGCG